ncbi:MAG: hypothetical protein NT069_24500, partial [Planctomycetota bacterium]|nr:hypothetical protein [Planctomycetota bacterium]
MGVPIRDSWRRVVSIAALLTLAVSLPAPSQETTPAGENAPAAAPPAVPADPNSNNSAPVTPDGAAGAPAVPVPVTAPPPPPPLELVPYRVRLELVLDLGADDSAANRSRLREEIRGMIAGQVGAFWDVEIPDEAAGWLASPADVT